MAQLYWTPNPADVGSTPSDWSAWWDALLSQMTVKNDGTNDYIEILPVFPNRNFYALDSIDGIDITNLADVEVYFEFTYESTNTDIRVVARGARTAFARGYTHGIRPSVDQLRLSYYDMDQFTAVGFLAFSGSTYTGQRLGQRVLVSGTQQKAKWWLKADGEQTGWTTATNGNAIEATDTGVSVAGSIGVFSINDGEIRVYAVGVGTNGDPAPTSAPTGGTDNLTANDISSTSEVTSPAIAQTHALTANDVSSLSSVTAPALGQTHSLSANDVQSTSQVSSPSLATQANTNNLTANDISSTSSTSSPTLGQVHNLAANDATSNTETGTPTLQQTHALTSVDVSSLSTVSSPALTSIAGQDSLAANDVQATSTVSNPTIGQVHNLTADNLSSQSETDTPALGQIHALTSNDIASISTVSSPTLRDASQVLATPIKNTKATVSQTTYKAAIIQPVYKAEAG